MKFLQHPYLFAELDAGVLRGVFIFILIGCGCLGLAAKAFSDKGIPVINSYCMTGTGAKAIGTVVGLFGLVMIFVPILMLFIS